MTIPEDFNLHIQVFLVNIDICVTLFYAMQTVFVHVLIQSYTPFCYPFLCCLNLYHDSLVIYQYCYNMQIYLLR